MMKREKARFVVSIMENEKIVKTTNLMYIL